MTTESYRTSFFRLTGNPESGEASPVSGVEIPLFQRDYAQGRQNDPVRRIRADFLDALHSAVIGEESASVGLDFVYGGTDNGTLQPLDGQQRLTTLFLLHWYFASLSGRLEEEHGWKNFFYATRQSARMFCESLVEHPLPPDTVPSRWVKDQPWYLFMWRHDPTIQSMLVVLDAIHERFSEVDPAAAWARLTDAENPAIWFLLLPLSGLGTDAGEEMRPEDLYIKMNSRGKPLTEFENFKAHFEKTIAWSPRSAEFALNVDTRWSDLLWNLRGDDNLIDDEFLRYLEFVTEICEWRDGRTSGLQPRLGERTRAVFGEDRPNRQAHLDFLFNAFDIWVDRSTDELFNGLFGADEDGLTDASRVPLFFRRTGESVNLFEGCCRDYGGASGVTRVFSLGQTLVLYAVVIHLIEDTPDLARRIRVLRNLIEASTDELRPAKMPQILEDVHSVIRDGAVDKVATLNQSQVEDEELKAEFLISNPALQSAVFALEDVPILRGSLGAFELEPEAFEDRARVFEALMSNSKLWSKLPASLLATGEYQRQRTKSRPFLFGTDSSRHDGAWRELLTGPKRNDLMRTRIVLHEFLNRMATAQDELAEAMQAITNGYLSTCEAVGLFDWRYYMVKYPSMREYGSSTFYSERAADMEQLAMGYSVCMMRAGINALNSNYRDPYLLAIAHELADKSVVEDAWFSGYEHIARRLPLTKSGATIRCVPEGFELTAPEVAPFAEVFEGMRPDIGCDADNLVRLPQASVDGRHIDTVDRIQVGSGIVQHLVSAGL